MTESPKINTLEGCSLPGSPRERGECDAYYSRFFYPHYYENGKRVNKENMTEEQIQEYSKGFNEWVGWPSIAITTERTPLQ